MNFETVKKNNKKKIIIGVGVLLILTSVVMFVSTRAKYRSVQSIKLANGVVDYKAPDLKIAIKVSEDGVNYTSSSEIPTGNYTFNTEKSKCRIPTSTLNGENAPVDNSITVEYVGGKLNFRGLTHNDTKCYVYFDKKLTTPSEETLVRLNITNVKKDTPDFTQIATGAETVTNNGIFETNDPMYGNSAKTYYWRGAATTNHVIFDNKCWRIVRINGDGTIRLIYNGGSTNTDGKTCNGNGANADSIVFTSSYNSDYINSSYVGWTYTTGSQRPSTNVPQNNGTAATIKTTLENWYNDNIIDKDKVALENFCNDRNIGSGSYSGTDASFSYAPYIRNYESANTNPSLACSNGDIYKLNVGLITADEVTFAGASGKTNNNLYYLYNGNPYWTMSPSQWLKPGPGVKVFVVEKNGYINAQYLYFSTYGVRPVINLRSDVTFNVGSDGTQNNPYIVQ